MDLKKKQKALRLISNGMYIITSHAGTKYGGATITWLSQVSFKPPLIMAAIRPESSVFACLSESRKAAIHILGSHQQEIARKFLASTDFREGLLNGEPFTEGTTSSPILQNISSYIECDVHQIIDGEGDHALVIMEAIHAEHSGDFKPLIVAESPWKYGG
jgi:flavin reductase (DIM6/NTAB) family NADH-FMN oxidoreductase RutF